MWDILFQPLGDSRRLDGGEPGCIFTQGLAGDDHGGQVVIADQDVEAARTAAQVLNGNTKDWVDRIQGTERLTMDN
jgi:myo-inositol-hexaphosphate 3-phosphohydrolase